MPYQQIPTYEIGQTYNRRNDIHSVVSGQQQGGISTPSNYPMIILFTGASGEAHGYNDGWEDGVFIYCGEGQLGDMSFERGNKAIRDHLENGKEIYLFSIKSKHRGHVIFQGLFSCSSFDWVTGPDTENQQRRVIRFHLVPSQDSILNIGEIADEDIPIDLRTAAYAASSTPGTSTVQNARKTYRKRSGIVKAYVLARAEGKCEGCLTHAPFNKTNGEPYLEK